MIRIVKMTFKTDKVKDFIAVFDAAKLYIASFPGCSGVELLRDTAHEHIFFTLSIWNSEASLNNYRESELFKTTWAKTKILFNDKPEAWSVENIL